MECTECSGKLDSYDIGCYRKLVNRGADSFLCRDCLAKKLGWERSELDGLIRQFIRQGCTLFPKETDYIGEEKQ